MISPWDTLDVTVTVRLDTVKSMEEEIIPPLVCMYVEASVQKLIAVLCLFRVSMVEECGFAIWFAGELLQILNVSLFTYYFNNIENSNRSIDN